MKRNYSNRTGWERYGSCMLYCKKGIVIRGLYLSPQGLCMHLTPVRVKGSSECRRCLLRDGYFILVNLGTDTFYDHAEDIMRMIPTQEDLAND